MSYKESIWFGILLYILLFAGGRIVDAFNLGDLPLVFLGAFVIAIVFPYIFARFLKTKDLGVIFKHSIMWAATVAILDVILSVQISGWEFFSQWQVYLVYALIVLVPLGTSCCSSKLSVKDTTPGNI